jgi:hypothetical protein
LIYAPKSRLLVCCKSLIHGRYLRFGVWNSPRIFIAYIMQADDRPYAAINTYCSRRVVATPHWSFAPLPRFTERILIFTIVPDPDLVRSLS